MAICGEVCPRTEKPAHSTISIRYASISIGLTVSRGTDWIWALPVEGGHADPDVAPIGKNLMGDITDVCVGTQLLLTHRLASVTRKDVSYDGKRRDRITFCFVPKEKFKDGHQTSEFLECALIAFSEFFAGESFNKAIVYDNARKGIHIEMRGQAHRRNAKKSFVVAPKRIRKTARL